MTVGLTNIQMQDEVADLPQNLTASDQDVTFYTISDARYFLGLVGLINSLRLTNHRNDLILLDCGLTASQRELLGPHCKLVDMSRELATNPTLFKPFPYLLNPTGTVVIIDSDILVTRSLEEIVNLANKGKICAFPDPESVRWFSEWQQLFDLPDAPRRQTYVNAGFVAFSTLHWPGLLEQWWRACERILSHPTQSEGAPNTEPSAQGDQDALNAVLMSEVPVETLALQPQEEAVFRENFYHVQVVDAQTLTCKYHGHTTTLLHSNGSPKPWNPQAWRLVRRRNGNMRLLRRLLIGADVALRVPPNELPIWLRPGILGQLSIYGLYVLNLIISVILLPKKLAKTIIRGLRNRRTKKGALSYNSEGNSLVTEAEK